jgi:RND family efflux transporter MFP subunit
MIKKIGIFLLIIIFSCNKSNNKNIIVNPINFKNIDVSSSIISTEFQKQIISNGKIEALNKSELRFKTSERIALIKTTNGQKVNKGQTLAVLDNAILKNQLNKAKINFDKAKSKLQEEKINFGLGDTSIGSIEPTVLKNIKIKSGYFEAQNTLENAQLLFNQTILKAPFSGVIANLNTKIENYITSSDVFCIVISQQQLEVVFSVLENELSFVKKKQDVSITSFVDKSKIYKGVITEINPIVDENGLIQIKAKINTPDNTLFDGMHIKVVINKPIKNVIVIPKEALVLRSNKEVVFTVENGLAKWNYVEVLDENGSSYAIKKGLKLSDTIIVSGNMNLSHDAKVNATFVPQQEDSN